MLLGKDWIKQLTVDLRSIIKVNNDSFTSMIPKIFGSDTTSKYQETDITTEGIPDFQLFTGTTDSFNYEEGYSKTIQFKEFVNAIDIKRSTLDDSPGLGADRNIRGKATDFSLSYMRTKEKYAASVFVNAFDATKKYSDGSLAILGDSKALCVDDHPSKLDSTFSGDNYKTTAFSDTEVEADRQAMAKFKDGSDNFVESDMDMLLVPITLEEQAYELVSSTNKVDVADNNKNFHYGKYKLAVWKYLEDINNWFSIDSYKSKRNLVWIERMGLESESEYNKRTRIYSFIAAARWNVMINDWRWVIGHKVTA